MEIKICHLNFDLKSTCLFLLNRAIMHWRVKNADNTLKGFHLDLQAMMGTKLPVALLNFAFKHTMLRKGMKKVKAAGFNGYTPEEIEQFGKDDLKVLSELLGDKQFFFGDDPNHLDLVAFSQIALVLNVDDSENGVKCPLKEFINAECTNLVGHYNRMKVNDIVLNDSIAGKIANFFMFFQTIGSRLG